MLELLRDPLWQFVGAALALFTLATSFLIYLLQRQRKAISYEVVSRNQLLTVREELEGKLQVLYEGDPTKDICLLVLKLINSGNLPVSTSDYECPISFATGANSKILSAVVTNKDPQELSIELVVEPSRVVVQPALLNPKDSITLKILVSDFAGSIIPHARIVGVKAITKASSNSSYSTLLMICGLVLLTFGVYLFMPKMPECVVVTPFSGQMKLGLALFVFGYVIVIVGMVKSGRFRLRQLKWRLTK